MKDKFYFVDESDQEHKINCVFSSIGLVKLKQFEPQKYEEARAKFNDLPDVLYFNKGL